MANCGIEAGYVTGHGNEVGYEVGHRGNEREADAAGKGRADRGVNPGKPHGDQNCMIALERNMTLFIGE